MWNARSLILYHAAKLRQGTDNLISEAILVAFNPLIFAKVTESEKHLVFINKVTVHQKNIVAERLNSVRRIIRASWKPKEFLGQSAVGFVWNKFVPILMGKKFEAD